MEYLKELLTILNEMSPYLLLGFLISGLLHVYVPHSLYTRFLRRKGFRSVINAALLGIPLPLCSCGVIPTSIGLKKDGASDGATVAFLVGTPQTGVDSLLATYSILGLPFAIVRAVAAFLVAIFSGVLVDAFSSSKSEYHYIANEPSDCSCGCSHSHSYSLDNSHKQRLLAALKYGFVYMMQDFGKWLIIGLLIAAAITAFIPDSAFTMLKEHYLLNIILILFISAPMYVCATGSVPIALSLMLKGVTPGAAFVLLMAGPATNIASLIVLRREIGLRKTVIYLLSIIVGALASAFVIDLLLPSDWFTALTPLAECSDGCCDDHHYEHCSHGAIWWQTTTSAIFIALFINAIRQKYRRRTN